MTTERIPTSLVFEPLPTGVRCAALDENGKPLWGYVSCKEWLSNHHQLVGVYDNLHSIIRRKLAEYNHITEGKEQANDSVQDLRKVIDEAGKQIKKLKTAYEPQNIKINFDSKAEHAAAIKGGLRNMITTLELIQSLKTGQSVGL